MSGFLELTILDSGSGNHAVAIGRHGSDAATENIQFGTNLASLQDFKIKIEKSLLGKDSRPTKKELLSFGNSLHTFLLTGKLRDLYARLSRDVDVHIKLLSDHSALQEIPWEFLQEPAFQPGPRRERSVVRIVPTIGHEKITPLRIRKSKPIRVLLAFSEPKDQAHIDWPAMEDAIRRPFKSILPDKFKIDIVRCKSIEDLKRALASKPYDIFHFHGHGELIPDADGKKVGHLFFPDPLSETSVQVSASELSLALGGRNLKLVFLSACETSSGSYDTAYSIISDTLVRRGIPAVIANQFPFPDPSSAFFACAVYEQLLVTGNIDTAVSEGRVALCQSLMSKNQAVIEWGLPTLHRRFGASQLFRI